MIEPTNSTLNATRRTIGWRRPVAVTVAIALVVPLVLSARSSETDATLTPSEHAAVVDVDEAAIVAADAAVSLMPGPDFAVVPMATTEEMEATRALLADYLVQLQEVVDREQFAAPGEAQLTLPAADLSSAVSSARDLVGELSGVELNAFGALVEANVGFSEQPAALDRAVSANPFDMNSVPVAGREEVLGEFQAPSGLRRVGDGHAGPVGHAARTASAGLAPTFGSIPVLSSVPAPGILSNCNVPLPSLRGLFDGYWIAAQLAAATNALAAGFPSSATFTAGTIVIGVLVGVTGALAIALEDVLMYAQDCAAATANAEIRAGLATDSSAVTSENPQGFTPGSTQLSVDELGTLISGVADDIDKIDAEIIEILADQRVVLEALGVAQTSALQIQTVGVSLQRRAGDLQANIGGADDGALEANRDIVCIPEGAPPGDPVPQPGDRPCNTSSGLANTIDERLDTILSDTADLQALSLRTAIERALADPSQPSIGLFALPAVQGGYLELVAEIVTDTLNNHRDAGQGIGNAEATLASANEAYAAGQFARAYDEYAKAYRDAVR